MLFVGSERQTVKRVPIFSRCSKKETVVLITQHIYVKLAKPKQMFILSLTLSFSLSPSIGCFGFIVRFLHDTLLSLILTFSLPSPLSFVFLFPHPLSLSPHSWRGRMQHALHNHWFHIVIVILVVLDAFIVMFELLLDVGAFSKSNHP